MFSLSSSFLFKLKIILSIQIPLGEKIMADLVWLCATSSRIERLGPARALHKAVVSADWKAWMACKMSIIIDRDIKA